MPVPVRRPGAGRVLLHAASIDPADSTVRGWNAIGYRITGKPREMQVDLQVPLEVDSIVQNGRPVRYRFPHQRARRLAVALGMIEDEPPPTDDALGFRRHLMRIPGIGPKTASWITRNWLGSDEVAILDIHIIRAGLLIGLFDRSMRVPRDYEALERRFLEFCGALSARPSLLDAVMWRAMRNIGRGPV